ncbi:hypothetical protein BDW22DRAFT_1432894 [Trametopsis cervina]|nr:hypothetical protein BDW22DRAFT_1432894 [Trametopsis cervina]
MSRRRSQSLREAAQPDLDRTAVWVHAQANKRYDDAPQRGSSRSTAAPSSSSTLATTLSRASGRSVQTGLAAFEKRNEERKNRQVVPPPTAPSPHSAHPPHSHSRSNSISVATINGLTDHHYSRAPKIVHSPVEEGWPKALAGRAPPLQATKASKPPTAYLRKRRPSDTSQGGSMTSYANPPHGHSTRSHRSDKPLPPMPASPVRQWTL